MGNILTAIRDWLTPQEIRNIMASQAKTVQSQNTESSQHVAQNLASGVGTSNAFSNQAANATISALSSNAQTGKDLSSFFAANPGLMETLKGLLSSSTASDKLNLHEMFKSMDDPKKAIVMIGVFLLVAVNIGLLVHAKFKHGSIKEYWTSLNEFAEMLEKRKEHWNLLKNIGKSQICKEFGTSLGQQVGIDSKVAQEFLNTNDSCVQEVMKALISFAKTKKDAKKDEL